MPCLAMHLAIAQQYCDKHSTEDMDAFTYGAIEPDIAPDKIASHYGISKPAQTVKQMLDNKIDIIACVNDFDMDNLQDRAEFLHLVTDYLFYNYIYKPDLERISLTQLNQALYEDYNYVTYYIVDKYNIVVPRQVAHLVESRAGDGDFEFCTRQQVDRFIDQVSSLDLNQTKQEIIQDKDAFVSNFIAIMNN